ncbi:MAG: hypothetical protein WD529_07240 [Balneolaceae bacterium]
MKIAKCTWDPVADADGYNVYLDGVKHNEELITDTQYFIPDLNPQEEEYEAYATSVLQGIESGPSDVAMFIIPVPVELFCEAAGIEMTSDFYTMEITGADELLIHKWAVNGDPLSTIDVDPLPFATAYLSATRFAGLNADESEFYIVNGQRETYAVDPAGAVVKTYDPAVFSISGQPDGHNSSVARDGRVAVYNSGNFDEDGLQVLKPDFTLDYSRTMYNLPSTDTEVGIVDVSFDACGNLIVMTNYEILILDPEYNVLFNENRDEFWAAGNSFYSMAVSESRLYLHGQRTNAVIPIALLDLDEMTYEVIVQITAEDDPNSQLDQFSNVNRSAVDKDGALWFAAGSGEDDVEEIQYLGLCRVTPEGAVHIWDKLYPGTAGGTPSVHSVNYSSPHHKLLFSFGSEGTVLVDIDVLDEGVEDVAYEAEINGTSGSSRFAPGEHSVLKGVSQS